MKKRFFQFEKFSMCKWEHGMSCRAEDGDYSLSVPSQIQHRTKTDKPEKQTYTYTNSPKGGKTHIRQHTRDRQDKAVHIPHFLYMVDCAYTRTCFSAPEWEVAGTVLEVRNSNL